MRAPPPTEGSHPRYTPATPSSSSDTPSSDTLSTPSSETYKTATLWKKQKSIFEPDFCATRLKDNPWIVQPFEIYEEIRIEEIKKKHQK